MSERGSIWYIHPYAGGPGIGRYDRAFHLSQEFLKGGVEPIVICPSFHHLMDAPQKAGTRLVQGIRHEFLRCPEYSGNGIGRILNMAVFTIQLLLQARRIVRSTSRPAAIIASSPHPYAYLAARRLATHFGSKCIFEVRDLWPLSLIELAGLSSGHPLVRLTAWVERRAYQTADAVVSLLPGTRDYMQERGLMSERWYHIPNGVSVGQSTITNSEDSALFSQVSQWRAAGCVIIVYAGALGLPNHVHSLVRALRLLPPGFAEVRAVIVGRGEMLTELKVLASDPILKGRIFFSDQIPKSSVQSLLSQADIGFLSLRPEPLFRFGISPNKLFDYMLARLPVIAAVRAGNDPVTESGCGIQVEPDDVVAIAKAIRWVADLPAADRHAMGDRGYCHVHGSHAYARLAAEYLEISGLNG